MRNRTRADSHEGNAAWIRVMVLALVCTGGQVAHAGPKGELGPDGPGDTAKPGARRPSPVTIEVRGRPGPKPTLDITMTNRTNQTLSLMEAELPWHAGLILIGVNTADHTQFRNRPHCLYGESQAMIQLRPGERLTGTLDLNLELSDYFTENLKKADVQMIWWYQFPANANEVPFAWVTGRLTFARSGESPPHGRDLRLRSEVFNRH